MLDVLGKFLYFGFVGNTEQIRSEVLQMNSTKPLILVFLHVRLCIFSFFLCLASFVRNDDDNIHTWQNLIRIFIHLGTDKKTVEISKLMVYHWFTLFLKVKRSVTLDTMVFRNCSLVLVNGIIILTGKSCYSCKWKNVIIKIYFIFITCFCLNATSGKRTTTYHINSIAKWNILIHLLGPKLKVTMKYRHY